MFDTNNNWTNVFEIELNGREYWCR